MKHFLLILILFFSAQSWSQEKRILIIGDSLTAGYGVPKAHSYPSVLETLLKEKKYEVKVINAGTSGSTSASAVSRLNWHLKVKPDILILALGANDGLRGFKLESTQKNLSSAIELAQKEQIKVILAGMKLPINYGQDYRRRFENNYSNLAEKYKTGFIPFLLKGVGGIAHLNLSDGIHPNKEGYKIVATTVLQYVEKYL